MGHLEITRASQEDAEIILHLQIHAYLSEAEIYNDYRIPPLIQTLKEIKQEFSQQVFLIALDSITHQYDAGAAWENLALEASSRGLVAHGMQGFDYEKARIDLEIPDNFDVMAMCLTCSTSKPENVR